MRPVIFSKARASVREKTHGHYPAPLAAIDVVEKGTTLPIEEGLKLEAKRFGELSVSEVSRALVSVFFATQEIKKDAGYPGGTEAREVHKLGVVGAGLMGAGIAAGGAEAGVPRPPQGHDPRGPRPRPALRARGVRRAAQAAQPHEVRVRRAHEPPLRQPRLLRASSTPTSSSRPSSRTSTSSARCLAEVEAATGKDCVFASNTSSLPIGDIAKDSWRPSRVLGMHFFSPVQKMPLLEVIVTPQTDAWATATAGAVRAADGQTRDRRAGRARLLHLARARALHERGGAPGAGGASIEDDRPRHGGLRFPGRAPSPCSTRSASTWGAKVAKILHHAFGERMAGAGVDGAA
jgi:3-hydroxyacyl-CoA dehydrogenase/enoyl-CoA hydratase/3-hydroxybutyryl-CoA epimerase